MRKEIILGLLLVLAGPLCFAVSGFVMVKAYEPKEARKAWPTTPGTITASRRLHEPMPGDNLMLEVEFVYEVAGQRHRHTQQWLVGEEGLFGQPTRDMVEAEAKYAVDKRVPVYYNPANPHEAVVNPLALDFELMVYVVSIVCIALWIGTVALPVKGIKLILQATRDGRSRVRVA